MNDPIVERLCPLCGLPNCKLCDECHGEIDSVTHACMKCGLESKNIQDIILVREPGDTGAFNEQLGEKLRQKEKAFRPRGYPCKICREWFTRDESERFATEAAGGWMNGAGNKHEKSGTNLVLIRDKNELNQHYRQVHSARYVSGARVYLLDGTTRLLSSYRIIPRSFISDESGNNLLKGDGQRLSSVQDVDSKSPTTEKAKKSTADSATSSTTEKRST